jgi:hypothetical protein
MRIAALPFAIAALVSAAIITLYPAALTSHPTAIAVPGCAGTLVVCVALWTRRVAYAYAGAALLVFEYFLALAEPRVEVGVEAPALGVLIFALLELVTLWCMLSSMVEVERRVLTHRAVFALSAAIGGAVISGLGLVAGPSVAAGGAVTLAVAAVAAVTALALPIALARGVLSRVGDDIE